MANLTKLVIKESFKDEIFRVDVNVSITKQGLFTTTLNPDDVSKIQSYGVKLGKNRLGRDGYFESDTLQGLESSIRKVLKECLSYEVIDEKLVIRYQILTSCAYCISKDGDIIPNASHEWTGYKDFDPKIKWKDGTQNDFRGGSVPFGLQVYAKPFVKTISRLRSGKEITGYKIADIKDIEAVEHHGSFNPVKWLKDCNMAPIQYYNSMMEVECDFDTAMFFVRIIKSLCNINENIKDLINPESILKLAKSNTNILEK